MRLAGGERAAAVQLSRDVALGQPSQRGRGLRSESQMVDRVSGPATLSPERRQRQEGLVLPWLIQRKSGFALSLTERLSFGVGYRHVRGEDLWREFADPGSIDYESHNFVLRAYWRY